MLKIIAQFLPILCVCFIEIYSNEWDPRVWPGTFVDDGKPFVEFTCGAYLKKKEWLSWYRVSNGKIFTTLQQQHDGYSTIKLLWPLPTLKDDEVYCAKENETYKNTVGTQYWKKKTKSKPIHITLERTIELPIKYLWSVDDGKRIEITGYAYLPKWNFLSCYQTKGGSKSKLGVIQQETNYGYKKITLQKTLEPSDNGSNIYCVSEDTNGNEIKSSINYIPITLERQMKALETYVTVEPSSDVVFFDEDDELEFVCHGSEPADGRALTWHLQSPDFYQVVPPDQKFYKSTNQNRLALPMQVFYHEKLLYCAQEFVFKFSNGTVTRYGELKRSRTITMFHRAQCNQTDRPRVTPEKFEDERKPFVQFTCHAFLETGQLLSWYQTKGLSKSAGSLLRMIQLQHPKSKEGEWVVLNLNKTLEPSDNGSELYCAQQSVLPDGNFSKVLNETERIPLKFERDIPPLEQPFIHVEPNNTDVSFAVNTTLRFVCSGSRPADGRNYTWFRRDLESKLTVPTGQTYDASTNRNVLDLPVDESYNGSELFCAQGFVLYIHSGGSLHVKSYGGLVSNKTTLIQREKQGDTVLILSLAVTLGAWVLVLAVACWAVRRRRPAPPAPAPPAPATRAPSLDNNDDIYGNYVNVSRGMASAQVTYAELDLKPAPGAAHAPPKPEPALYAEIVKQAPAQPTYAVVDLKPVPAARAPPAPEPALYEEIYKKQH